MICKVPAASRCPLLAASAACCPDPLPRSIPSTIACDQGKTLVAEYFNGAMRTAPNGMPMPGGHVVVTLADGTTPYPAADRVGLGHPLRQRGRIVRVLEQGRRRLRRGRAEPDRDLLELRGAIELRAGAYS